MRGIDRFREAVVPMVVPKLSLLAVAGRRSDRLTPCNHNGQRRRALAVGDYESRALPLSYGGGGPNVATGRSTRYPLWVRTHDSSAPRYRRVRPRYASSLQSGASCPHRTQTAYSTAPTMATSCCVARVRLASSNCKQTQHGGAPGSSDGSRRAIRGRGSGSAASGLRRDGCPASIAKCRK